LRGWLHAVGRPKDIRLVVKSDADVDMSFAPIVENSAAVEKTD
jgi:hypothetical protein